MTHGEGKPWSSHDPKDPLQKVTSLNNRAITERNFAGNVSVPIQILYTHDGRNMI